MKILKSRKVTVSNTSHWKLKKQINFFLEEEWRILKFKPNKIEKIN